MVTRRAQARAAVAYAVCFLITVLPALLILGYVSIFALVPLLAHKVERFHTFAAREMNICFKLSFFQVRA